MEMMDPKLQTAWEGLRRIYTLAGAGRCGFPTSLRIIFARVMNWWTAWLNLAHRYISILFHQHSI